MSADENHKASKVSKGKCSATGKPGSKRSNLLRIFHITPKKTSRQKNNKGSKKKSKREQRLQTAYEKAKNYRDCLNEVAAALSEVIQHNLEYTRDKRELVFEAPETLDDYELIFKTLEKNRHPGKPFASFPNIEQYSLAMHEIIAYHREYHQQSAVTLKPVGDFLYKEFPEIESQYQKINRLHEELDQDRPNHEGARRAADIEEEIKSTTKELEKILKKTMTAETVLRHATAILDWRERHKTFHGKALDGLGHMMKRCNLDGDLTKVSWKEELSKEEN